MTRSILLLCLTAAPAALNAQAPGGSDVPRATYLATMDAEFRKMDTDKNGMVTRSEVEAFQRAAAVAESQSRARQIFVQLDSDKNGQLSEAELARGVNPATAPDARPLFGQLDSNRDGRISLVEHRAGKLAYFDKIDLDKDGVVTIEEMRSAGVIK